MNWLKKISNKHTTIVLNPYKNTLWNYLVELYNYSLDEKEKLKNFKIDLNLIKENISDYPYQNTLLDAINSNDREKIEEETSKFYKFYNEGKNPNQKSILLQKIRPVLRQLWDLSESLNKEEYSLNNVKETYKDLVNKTYSNLTKIQELVETSINNIPNWNNTKIIILSRPIDKDSNVFEPDTDAEICFGSIGDMSPNFTIFNIDGKIVVDDILEAGDEDFFKNVQVQSDYFNLVKKITNPSSSKNTKTLTLYTSRPVEDRNIYLDKKEIPSNIFLTNNLNSAEGLSIDLSSGKRRDVWKVRIDSNYLIETLNSPSEKQYQAVDDKMIPVKSLELIIPSY